MAGKFRHEQKYYINQMGYRILRSRFRTALRPDENADETGEYHIRSLYFDDRDDASLTTKIAGVDEREKFRVRIYNKSDMVIRLEQKLKKNEYILKRSCAITKQEYQMLLDGDGSFLLERGKPPCGAVYAALTQRGLHPVKIVDYVREAYVYPIEDVRITFDKDLRAGTSLDLFDRDMLTVSMLEPGLMVLEVKFNAFLPGFIRDLFTGVESTRCAVSKYAICRKYDV